MKYTFEGQELDHTLQICVQYGTHLYVYNKL